MNDIKKNKKTVIWNLQWHSRATIAGRGCADRKGKCRESMCTTGWLQGVCTPAIAHFRRSDCLPKQSLPCQSAALFEQEVHVILQSD